jgi:peptidoglycan/xylan/chitin deacetylase (PgdA/CDA1 family)
MILYTLLLLSIFLNTINAHAIPNQLKARLSSYAYLNQICGTSSNLVAYPGTGNKSESGLCCSVYGYAGVTDDHCFLSRGCQPSWGRCVNDAKVLPNAPTVYTGCTKPGLVAVAYDDGPGVLTSSLLDYLATINVKVTFFVNGINWKAAPTGNPLPGLYALQAVVLRAYQEGHQICSHTWSHTDFITVNQYNNTYEMSRLNNAFRTILGVIPTCVRPPYGDYDATSLRVLQGLGYGEDSNGAIVTWNLDEMDWDPAASGTTPTQQINEMTTGLEQDTKNQITKTGFVTLNHDVWNTTADFRPAPNGTLVPNKIKPFTQRTIEYLQSQKWKLVLLDECLGRPTGSLYRSVTPSDTICGDSGSYGAGSCFL